MATRAKKSRGKKSSARSAGAKKSARKSTSRSSASKKSSGARRGPAIKKSDAKKSAMKKSSSKRSSSARGKSSTPAKRRGKPASKSMSPKSPIERVTRVAKEVAQQAATVMTEGVDVVRDFGESLMDKVTG